VNQDGYLRQVLNLYLEAPETPHQVRRSDRTLAITFYQQRIPLADLRYAIAIVSLRRARRDIRLPSLDPISSLAYFRPTVERLQQQPVEPGYALYIEASYRTLLEEAAKNAIHRRNAAVFARR
jgi:hypothetical protein